MASLITYSKQMFIERCKRHIANTYPDSSFSVSDMEILLYIDAALAYTLVGQVFNLAKVEGALTMPESYLITYSLPTLTQDTITGEWYSVLPQPPVSLPLGYSITDVYPVEASRGRGDSFLPIKSKRTAYRNYMPKPPGGSYKVNGSKIILMAADGSSLFGLTFYAEMASSRTSDLSETMALPDDAIEVIFQNVTTKMIQRMQLPKDIVQDDIGAGNKAS